MVCIEKNVFKNMNNEVTFNNPIHDSGMFELVVHFINNSYSFGISSFFNYVVAL